MSFALEKLIPAHALRIIWVQELPPSAVLSLAHVRPTLKLRNDSLQIELADTLKECLTIMLDVIRVQ